MTEIVIPQLDANSETAKLVRWEVADGAVVQKGEALCTIETSKAIYEVEAEAAGIVIRVEDEGATIRFNVPVGYIAPDAESVAGFRAGVVPAAAVTAETAPGATRKATELARKHGVDLASVPADGIITESDVEAFLAREGKLAPARPKPGDMPAAVKRVLVIAAGYGAMQVIDILMNYPDVRVVGCVDDDATLMGREIFGAPVIGAIGDIPKLWESQAFDYAIVAISTNIGLRRRFFEMCTSLGIPMINAVDPTVRINRGAVIGSGNVICSQCHIGVAAQLGDNNFISAHTSIDHHNMWGSHCTTGPACATSGAVTVGDEVKFGTGIFVQPNLSIGRQSIIASGAVIIRNVPAGHAVRVRLQVEMRGMDEG